MNYIVILSYTRLIIVLFYTLVLTAYNFHIYKVVLLTPFVRPSAPPAIANLILVVCSLITPFLLLRFQQYTL